MSDKVWVPGINIKAKTTEYGEMLKVGIKVDTMVEFLQNNANEKGYVNLIIGSRRQVGTYGETHSASLDTWTPDGNNSSNATEAAPAAQPAIQADDLPF